MKSIYLVIDTSKNGEGDEFYDSFYPLEAANKQAAIDWNYLTKKEKQKRQIYVGKLSFKNFEEGEWTYDDLEIDGTMFNSQIELKVKFYPGQANIYIDIEYGISFNLDISMNYFSAALEEEDEDHAMFEICDIIKDEIIDKLGETIYIGVVPENLDDVVQDICDHIQPKVAQQY